MTWVHLAAAAALFAGGTCAALVASAKADDEPIRTVYWKHELFTKGVPFEVECERGSYLVGFEGRAGAWVNHLLIVCARWDAVRGKLEQPAVLEERKVGYSQGGVPARPALCPSGTGIAGDYDEHYARDGSSYILHTLEFHCVNATDGTRPRWRMFGSTWSLDAEYNRPLPHAGCPQGYLATGIYGRAGEFIDRLFGFVCRRRPTAYLAGEKANDAAKAKANNSKWAVGGTRRIGNDIVTGGVDIVAGGDAPPSPTVAMAETTNDTDVYRRVVLKNNAVIFQRLDDDPAHFLPKGFPAPVLDKEGGWWKLDLTKVDFVKGEGWVAADQLKMK